MGGAGFIILFQFSLVIGSVLFLFTMLYRIVKSLELIATTYASRNTLHKNE